MKKQKLKYIPHYNCIDILNLKQKLKSLINKLFFIIRKANLKFVGFRESHYSFKYIYMKFYFNVVGGVEQKLIIIICLL